jgi:two-component system, NarL family, sensor kinase
MDFPPLDPIAPRQSTATLMVVSLTSNPIDRARTAFSRGARPRVDRRLPASHPRIPREVVRFVGVVVVVAAIIGAGGFLVLSQETIAEAQRSAEAIARVQGLGVVQPELTDPLLLGDAEALAELDRVIRTRVLDARTVRVKIWDSTGRIVYSDEPRLIGETFPLGTDEQGALRSNLVNSEVSDLSRPENRYERSFGQLLEVYLPLQDSSGDKLLFETYQEYASVQAEQNRMMFEFGRVLVIGLLLLLVLAVPLAWSMARRLETAAVEREALLTRAVEASETERQKIASDLHDGVVQRLVGTGMSLGAASRKVEQGEAGDTDPQVAKALQNSAGELREAVRELRTLIVKIAPSDLSAETLAEALGDLVGPLRSNGIDAEVQVGNCRLDAGEARLMFRVAQEALRNVARHAGARHVQVEVATLAAGRTLIVTDDGRGFDPDALAESQRQGHMGLKLLKSLAEDGGAKVRVVSSPGHGTRVEMSLP